MSHMLGFKWIREFNFSKLNQEVPTSVIFCSCYIRHVRSLLLWKKKGEFNFSKLNYYVQDLHSKQPFSEAVEKKKKRIQLFEVEISNANVNHRSLSCRKPQRRNRRPLLHMVDPTPELATRLFPTAYFRTKVRSRGFMPEIKRAFNRKKGCEQHTNGSPNPGQKTRPYNNQQQQKKRESVKLSTLLSRRTTE